MYMYLYHFWECSSFVHIIYSKLNLPSCLVNVLRHFQWRQQKPIFSLFVYIILGCCVECNLKIQRSWNVYYKLLVIKSTRYQRGTWIFNESHLLKFAWWCPNVPTQDTCLHLFFVKWCMRHTTHFMKNAIVRIHSHACTQSTSSYHIKHNILSIFLW